MAKNHPEVLLKMAIIKSKENPSNFIKKERSPPKKGKKERSPTILKNLTLFK